MATTEIIKQTVVYGSGRRTQYSDIPTWEEVDSLRALGYSATLINIAPRGGIWGETIQVPSRQAAKAKRALAGEMVYASRAAERAAKAKAKAQRLAGEDVAGNVVSKTDVELFCDVASVKVKAQEFRPLNEHMWVREGAHMVPNFHGDGPMRLSLVRVRDAQRRFSRHEAFGDEAPPLMAEASGWIKIYNYDCGETCFEVIAAEPVRFYSQNHRVYLVGTAFSCDVLGITSGGGTPDQ